MLKTGAIEKLAQKELYDEVYLSETIKVNTVSVYIWRRKNIKPALSTAIFVCAEKPMVASKSFKNFETLLQLSRPSLDDFGEIVQLINKAAPPKRIVIQEPSSPFLLPKYREIWEPPLIKDGILYIFCNDVIKGTFEKVIIDSGFHVKVEKIGPGKQIRLK